MVTTTARDTMLLLDRMDGPDLSIHPERCVLVRNRNASCLLCAQACTSGAIYATEDGLEVNPDLCIGCGTCATACPTCALEPRSPDDQTLARAAATIVAQTDGSVVFICTNAAQAAREQLAAEQGIPARKAKLPGTVELACLGRLDETVLVELAIRRALRIFCVHGDCTRCEHAIGGTLCNDVIEVTRRIFEAYGCATTVDSCTEIPRLERTDHALDNEGIPKPVRCYTLRRLSHLEDTPQELLDAATAPVYPEPEPPATDAGISTDDHTPQHEATVDDSADNGDVRPGELANGATTIPEQPRLAHVGASGALPQYVPTRRTRLYNCLRKLGDAQIPLLETRLWGTVSIDTDRCKSCRMCTVFCPTGALRKFESVDGASFGVSHQPTLCVACGTCQSICREQAITIDHVMDLETFTGGTRIRYELNRPDWEPNKSDSIYKKMLGVLGAQNNLAVY